jgi:adenylate kinase
MVINFFNKEEVLIQKMAGRRVCPQCDKNFNVASVQTECGYTMAPLLPKGDDPTVCDGDHPVPVKLVTRRDDTPEVITERLQIYKD